MPVKASLSRSRRTFETMDRWARAMKFLRKGLLIKSLSNSMKMTNSDASLSEQTCMYLSESILTYLLYTDIIW